MTTSPASPAPRRRLGSRTGFTLIELAVVVLIIGLLAALGVPAYKRITRSAKNTAVMNDFRVIAAAFNHYASDNGSKWPADQATGTGFPTGMQNYLRTSNWGVRTPFGGYYNWDYNQTHQGRVVKAAVAIYAGTNAPVTVTTAELLEFDKKFDDGNLTTGTFRQGYQNCPLYVIEN